MKNKAFWIVIGIIIILIIAGFYYFQNQKKDMSLKIGVILPLSGNGAIYGEWGRNALDIAKDEINNNGGVNGKNIELIYEDGKFNPTETVNSYNKLVNINNVKYVITIGSAPAVAVSPLANKDKVIQMDFSATTSAYRSEGDFTFRTAPQAEQFGTDAAKWFMNNNQSEVSVLYINNEQGVSIYDSFQKDYAKLGGKIISAQKFSQDGTDFKTEIIETLNHKNYLFLIGHLKESGLIVKEMNELGYNNPILSHVYSVEGSDFINTAGNFSNKIIYLAPDYKPNKNNLTIEYNKVYKERYGEDSEYFGAFGYDALKVLFLAISKCSNSDDTECVKDELFKIKGYEGLTGDITFDKYGDRIVDLTMKEIKNGNFVEYKG